MNPTGKPNQVRTLAVFAAGKGLRMFGPSGGRKALIDIGGRPLIGYLLDECYGAGIERLILVVDDCGTDLVDCVRSWGRMTVEYVVCHEEGTLPAVLAAIKQVGDQPFVLATCDLFGPPGVLRENLRHVCSVVDGTDIVVCVGRVEGEEIPIWVAVDDVGRITDYGKRILPTGLIALGIRIFYNSPVSVIETVGLGGVATDSELMSWLLRTGGMSARAHRCPAIFDVDSQSDLARARRMASIVDGPARGSATEGSPLWYRSAP